MPVARVLEELLGAPAIMIPLGQVSPPIITMYLSHVTSLLPAVLGQRLACVKY